MKFNKQIFLEKKWSIEKAIIKTIMAISLFATLVYCDPIADTIGEIIEGLGDLIYDNTGFGSRTSEDIASVVIIYAMVIGCDRFMKVLPFIIKKLSTRHASRKKTEVSE